MSSPYEVEVTLETNQAQLKDIIDVQLKPLAFRIINDSLRFTDHNDILNVRENQARSLMRAIRGEAACQVYRALFKDAPADFDWVEFEQEELEKHIVALAFLEERSNYLQRLCDLALMTLELTHGIGAVQTVKAQAGEPPSQAAYHFEHIRSSARSALLRHLESPSLSPAG